MKHETFQTLQDEIDRLDALSRRLSSRLFYLAAVAGICGGILLGLAIESLMTRHAASAVALADAVLAEAGK